MLAPGLSGPSLAEPAETGCRLIEDERVRVAGVIDGDTLKLEDGRILRLVTALAPKGDLPGSGRAEPALGDKATRALAEAVEGAELVLSFGKHPVDRHGRLLAQAFADGDPARWLQGLMVGQGLARAYATVDNYRCVGLLLKQEALARDAGLGLWASGFGPIYRADRPEDLAGENGRFAIVEGRVLSVGERPRRTYLNFGTYWNEDFTVFVDRADLAGFADAGLALKGLEGRRIRVRGWIREDRGPAIRMTRPEQLELVD